MALLLRIILSSTKLGDTILDPFAGTGTALVAAHQLGRNSIGIEIDLDNVKCIKSRLEKISEADDLKKFYKEYVYTENVKKICEADSIFFTLKKKQDKLNLLFAV